MASLAVAHTDSKYSWLTAILLSPNAMDELNHRKLAFRELRATTATAVKGKWKSLSLTGVDLCDPEPRIQKRAIEASRAGTSTLSDRRRGVNLNAE